MKHGFIKIAACSPNIRVADCAYNALEMNKAIEEAASQGVHILTFPELSLKLPLISTNLTVTSPLFVMIPSATV